MGCCKMGKHNYAFVETIASTVTSCEASWLLAMQTNACQLTQTLKVKLFFTKNDVKNKKKDGDDKTDSISNHTKQSKKAKSDIYERVLIEKIIK